METVVLYFNVLYYHLPWRSERSHENSSVRMAGVTAKIWSSYLSCLQIGYM